MICFFPHSFLLFGSFISEANDFFGSKKAGLQACRLAARMRGSMN